MNILPYLLNQKCVYWPPTTKDKFTEQSLGSAQGLDCRWDNTVDEIPGPNETTIQISATVYVSVEVQAGGWMWLGNLVDAPADPRSSHPYQQIKAVKRHPDTENDEIVYIAMI